MAGQKPPEPKKRVLERVSIIDHKDLRTYLLRKVREYKEKEQDAGKRSKVYFDSEECAIVAVDLDELLAYEEAMGGRT